MVEKGSPKKQKPDPHIEERLQVVENLLSQVVSSHNNLAEKQKEIIDKHNNLANNQTNLAEISQKIAEVVKTMSPIILTVESESRENKTKLKKLFDMLERL